MSLGSVISTLLICFFFNIILPTGDVGSDLNLIYQAWTFNLGDSLELEGCKSCYLKTDKEVYYQEKDLTSKECKTCIYDPLMFCGRITTLKIINFLEKEKYKCLNNETFIRSVLIGKVTHITSHGECNDDIDTCCVTQTREIKSENPIQKLDPKNCLIRVMN